MPSVHPKRQRTEAALVKPPTTASIPTHSRILAPFRSIGHTTSSVAPSILPQGQTFQISTALDRTVQTYDVRKLNLLFVTSPPTPATITKVVAHKDLVYAAFGDGVKSIVGVWIFKRGKKAAELQEPTRRWGAWKDLVIFGTWVVGAFDKAAVVWRKDTGEIHTELEMGGQDGALTAICHPASFLNKVVIARRNGDLQIWNVKTGKLIYTILSPIPATSVSASKAITTLVQTPAICVLAAGYSTGEVLLHNILTDTTLFTMNQPTTATASTTKRVTSLSFCTDPFVGAGKTTSDSAEGSGRILAVGHDDGFVTLWNLTKRRVFGELRNSHEPSPQGVHAQWLTGQNILVTTAGDNSIKEWVFDSPHSSQPRLLRSRSGHAAPITAMAFVSPNTNHFLLSGSRDRSLRAQSLRNDSQNFEFSQGAAVKKANKMSKRVEASIVDAIAESKAGPITCIATSAGEDGAGSAGREWESIVTGHQSERAARCWSLQNKKIGRWTLPTTDEGEVKSVAITACGTFALIGSVKGGIDMYNLQSGIHRRKFPAPLTPAQARIVKKGEAVGKLTMIGQGKHTKAVTGIVSDSLNRVVITSGLDGKIKFWEFVTGILIHEIDWNDTVKIPSKMKFHRPSELLAVACDDMAIRVIDVETKKVVRELWGAEGKISDFAFSNDGRWIVASSMDSVIRIWDLPTGHLIDGVRTKTIVSALAFAGSGEFLATAHVGSVGVSLWTNRTLFRHVPTRAITDGDIVDLQTPTISGEGGTSLIAAALANPEDDAEGQQSGIYTTIDQLSNELLTMSLVPRNRWQTLVNLDAIRARNKPKEAPKAPEKAPFFLSALTGSNTSGADPATDAATDALTLAAERDRILRIDPTANAGESKFTTLLRDTQNPSRVIDHLKTLSPSSADLEIRSLREGEEMISFVKALTARMTTRKDWELVMAWMSVFMKCHGAVVVEEEMDEGGQEEDEEEDWRELLRRALKEWRGVQVVEQKRLSERVGFCLGVAEFLRSGR
ncbi:Utp21-domain-containing protein [Ascodesmis nigricans]|uniref:Utp21-domain-containing protein n=1 Tax=Ascodesmis nigricans TaxID=341454 RepID=A0A4S2N0G4_9PEZI|nr:Utp21-domain-containing protein [Ascodesmis nigricans]